MKYNNAKVEAKYLMKKFKLYLGTDAVGEEYFTSDLEAKISASIAVNIILDFINHNVVPYTYDKDSMEFVIANEQHYIKVLKELEIL